MIGRRLFLGGGLALAIPCGSRSFAAAPGEAFAAIRNGLGPLSRMGVAALDMNSGRSLTFDGHGRYAMASTFKIALAALVLKRAEERRLSLATEIPFGEDDLLAYAPVARANLDRKRLSITALCAAIIEQSDNTAANLLLARVGGPAGLTRFMRSCGDGESRLDRSEPGLNANAPGDPRDTTTPAAMLGLMQKLLVGDALAAESRKRLIGWMSQARTGLDRLRAGLPAHWEAGDKTGTGANGAHNDIAIAMPPGRAPILIASYQSGGDAAPEVRAAAHAKVARLIVEQVS